MASSQVECLRLARVAEDSDTKALLLEMAQMWIRLALQARKNEERAAS